ncbi:MAG: hypothetical protein ACM3SR_19265 [Ignavibacteriales bacterium]
MPIHDGTYYEGSVAYSVSHKRRIIQNPDMSYSNWHYKLGDCCACDIDWVETNASREPVAIIETIKGLGKVITPYKREVYENLSRLSGLPFYIVNYDFEKGKFAITNQRGVTVIKNEAEYKAWLGSLRNKK